MKAAVVKSVEKKTAKNGNSYISLTTQQGGRCSCFTEAMFERLLKLKDGDEILLELTEKSGKDGKKNYYIEEFEYKEPPTPDDEPDEPDDPNDLNEVPDDPNEPEDPEPAPEPKSSKPKTEKAALKAAKDIPAPQPVVGYKPDDEESEGENFRFYKAGRKVPATAKRPITAGKLSGKTDINPMWRIKKLTELFGPVGIGWYENITDIKFVDSIGNVNDFLNPEKNTTPCIKGEITCFVAMDLYYKVPGTDNWSAPVHGTGGRKFIDTEKGNLVMSDEAIKCARTDAEGQCCKLLGIGADVYWEGDSDDKYM